MTKEEMSELIECYNSLIELGVVFYYNSAYIPMAEVTALGFLDNGNFSLELDEETTKEIDIDDFIENHFKEGNNYHTWHLSRRFDSLLDS